MGTGMDLDNQNILKAIAQNTKAIALQLERLNGMLELIYKNGLPRRARE